MTDTTETTPKVLSEEQLAYAIGSLRIFADTFKDSTDSDPCYDIDKLDSHIDALTAERDQQAHWDAISRDQTIETLRGEVGRLREALEWYADHTIYEPAFANGGDDLDSHGMKSLAGIDSGNRARVALGMGVTP